MTIEIAIAVSVVLGLIVGLAIGRQGRKDRDEKIKELEGELTIKQNVCEAQNDTIQRLRKKLDKRNAKTD